MALTEQAPYGSTGAIVKLLETYRETGLGGAPVTPALVGRLGFGDEVSRRVVHSMRMLELTDEEGVPTDTLRAFKTAASADYRRFLADHLLSVYEPVFSILGTKIGEKSNAEIEDAFRHFKPDSLRKRMVALFIGLCGYVGLGPETLGRSSAPRTPGSRVSRSGGGSGTKSGAGGGTTDTPPPAENQMTDGRARYLDLLIAKAEETGEVDLFDRIERVLGVAPAKEAP